MSSESFLHRATTYTAALPNAPPESWWDRCRTGNNVSKFCRRSRARRYARATAMKAWQKEWRHKEKSGGYATANRIPPSTLPSQVFRNTPREVFGWLIQCKTNHGYTGEFKRRFLPQEEHSCPCGEEFQTREHVIAHCTLHEEKRDALRKVSRDLWLPTILGTKDGITALTLFLKETTAFTCDGHQYTPPPTPSFEHEKDDPDDPVLTPEPPEWRLFPLLSIYLFIYLDYHTNA